MTNFQRSVTLALYTQDGPFHRRNVKAAMDKVFTGYSLFQADGVWNGKGEPALKVEVIVLLDDPAQAMAKMRSAIEDMEKVIEVIKVVNKQEAVLLTVTDSLAKLL